MEHVPDVLTYAVGTVPTQARPWLRKNAAQLVATLAASPRPLSVRELARVSAVPLSTTHRLLGELVDAGVVTMRTVGSRAMIEISPGYERGALPTLISALPPLDAVPSFHVIDAELLARYRVDYRGRPFLLAAEGATLPAGLPSRVIWFNGRQPLEWKHLWAEEIVVGLLTVDPAAALQLAKSEHVDNKRLRECIHKEGRVREAITSGVADVAWSHRHYLIHLGYKFPR